MADEDREKAEKVAAAKKRYEQLKKQKKKGGKKKEEKATEPADAEAAPVTEKAEEAIEQKEEGKEEGKAEQPLEEKTGETVADTPAVDASPEADEDGEPAELPKASSKSHGRKPSMAQESRLRSASFYRSGEGGPTSPGGAVSADIFREQAHKIEELEKENRRLLGEVEDGKKRWKKGEEELEELREGRGDLVLAAERGKEADKLRSELESVKRQLSHLQTQTSKNSRKVSTPSPSNTSSVDDLTAQVASKSATIESLELEISSLNKQMADQKDQNSALQNQINSLETALHKAEQEAASTHTELSDLKKNLEMASETAEKEGTDRSSAETRIAQLEAELGAANRKASDAVTRAEQLEKKVEMLTQLHRDNDARNQARTQEKNKFEREAAELRTRIASLTNENSRLREAEQRHKKTDLGSIEDSSVQEILDEERDKLLTRVRELDEENSELKRGIWRDKRRDMQPIIDDDQPHHHQHPYASGFQDVDLSGNTPARQAPRHGSTLQDVIKSGISAFTGQSAPQAHRRSDAASHKPKASLELDDDFEFDEEAFRAAQEEEGRKRLERIREIKRGLKNWEGWRADFVDVRAGWGGVFEV